jgi:hypothetical protein
MLNETVRAEWTEGALAERLVRLFAEEPPREHFGLRLVVQGRARETAEALLRARRERTAVRRARPKARGGRS